MFGNTVLIIRTSDDYPYGDETYDVYDLERQKCIFSCNSAPQLLWWLEEYDEYKFIFLNASVPHGGWEYETHETEESNNA